jgi:4-amino-4-deoxy-L-arabinose transferase-like glycosyltransferase
VPITFWKSPQDQPAWARPALLAITAAAALLYARNIADAGLEGFYAIAVKSMSVSWKAFVYGAFDPRATITLDKLAGSFVPQAISARVFGFHPWSLALPQVIEGVISVLVMYRVVRRWAGPGAGLLGAAIFALTPVAVSMFGHSMEDGALTMCLVLAADSCQRAMLEGRLRSLLWAAFWVGAGFQAKMLQAWIVLPALAVAYLVTAPLPAGRRLRDLSVAGAACLAVSLSWVLLYTLVPAGHRPYIDGSTNNSAIAMVFGYNGVGRFGVSFPGSVQSMFGRHGFAWGQRPGEQLMSAHQSQVAAVVSALERAGFGGGASGGWGKLAGSEFGPQIGWLFPLALLALGCGLAWTRGVRESRGGFVMWGTWLISYGLVFSAMHTIPHTAYVASLAPCLAALAAAGIVMFWREYAGSGWRGWLLPAAVAAETAWAGYLWSSYLGFLPWVLEAIVVAGILTVLAMVLCRLSWPPRRGIIVLGAAAGAAAMIAAPAAWAVSALDPRYDGSEMNATAGPAANEHRWGAVEHALGHGAASAAMRAMTPTGTLTPAQQAVYAYVSAHRDGAAYLMATGSWVQAGPYILATGQEIMPVGGFSGSVPSPTLAAVQQLVARGQLRFFLLSPPGEQMWRMGGDGGQAQVITSWVRQACAPVPPAGLYRCGNDDHGPKMPVSTSGGP